MKNRNVIVILLSVVLIVLGISYYWSNTNQIQEKTHKSAPAERLEDAIFKPSPPKNMVGKSRSESDPAPSENEIIQLVMKNEKTKKMYVMGSASNSNIYFYGRVVDQHGEPVSNALVKTEVGAWRILDANSTYYHYKTDEQGFFSIEGMGGSSLSVRIIEKEGYDIKGGESFYGYKNSKADSSPLWGETSEEKPWIFHAWKKTESEPLYSGKYKQKLQRQGVFEEINIPGMNHGLSAK
ncbi:MAG: carboxypeptidase-like regulatory domain-containing protein, partial [Mariprofundaceae bacterium]|nr:carboxypeptidase-like regulatory domain-containing protein [Mariprofundaceae bacterium]